MTALERVKACLVFCSAQPQFSSSPFNPTFLLANLSAPLCKSGTALPCQDLEESGAGAFCNLCRHFGKEGTRQTIKSQLPKIHFLLLPTHSPTSVLFSAVKAPLCLWDLCWHVPGSCILCDLGCSLCSLLCLGAAGELEETPLRG